MSLAILFAMHSLLEPGSDTVLELNTLAILIAAVPYGIVIVLYTISVLALLNSGGKYSKRKKNLLLAYITLTLLLSTTAYISSILYIIQAIFLVDILKGRVHITDPAWIYPLSILAADAFMVSMGCNLSLLFSPYTLIFVGVALCGFI